MDDCKISYSSLQREANNMDISKTVFKERNEELYSFLSSTIENIPSLRQKKVLPFTENPWDMALDELNAMNNTEYDILSLFVNGDEREISEMIVMDKVLSFLEKFPILSYSIILRRKTDNPWICNIIVLSDASNLHPYKELLSEPLHPFSSLYLSEEVEKYSKESFAYIKSHECDESRALPISCQKKIL